MVPTSFLEVAEISREVAPISVVVAAISLAVACCSLAVAAISVTDALTWRPDSCTCPTRPASSSVMRLNPVASAAELVDAVDAQSAGQIARAHGIEHGDQPAERPRNRPEQEVAADEGDDQPHPDRHQHDRLGVGGSAKIAMGRLDGFRLVEVREGRGGRLGSCEFRSELGGHPVGALVAVRLRVQARFHDAVLRHPVKPLGALVGVEQALARQDVVMVAASSPRSVVQVGAPRPMSVCNFCFAASVRLEHELLRQGVVRDPVDDDVVGVGQPGNGIARDECGLPFDVHETSVSDDGHEHHQSQNDGEAGDDPPPNRQLLHAGSLVSGTLRVITPSVYESHRQRGVLDRTRRACPELDSAPHLERR